MAARRRVIAGVVALVAIQAAIAGVYLAVTRARGGGDSSFRVERLRGDARSPEVTVERADGSLVRLGGPSGRPRLVHFWATWCPPCVEELPGLIATARELELELVAISMDDSWAPIERFFGGQIPGVIVRARGGEARRGYDVVSLPDTYLVDSDGRLRLRYGGARDWQAPAARRHLAEQIR